MVPRTGPRMCNWPPEDDKVRNPMRLPFFYGWIVVAVTFVTMAIGVNARTSFSLLFPPIIDEFGWERGVTAGAFSFGFLASGVASPLIGRMMDRFGPRAVMELGIALMGGGLLLAPLTTQPWHLYLTLGVMVGAGSVCLGYSGQSLFLPNWFNRRRGLALGLAFTGVGIGSITLLPWAQHMIEQTGWRTACTAIGILVLVVLAPINLLLRKRPEDIGLRSDGDAAPSPSAKPVSYIVDPDWAGIDWTLSRAVRTARFWWLALGYFCALYIWYAVQVHQTKYLLDIGFSPGVAVWALGVVSLLGIPGQIVLGHLSDRLGREWIWTTRCLGSLDHRAPARSFRELHDRVCDRYRRERIVGGGDLDGVTSQDSNRRGPAAPGTGRCQHGLCPITDIEIVRSGRRRRRRKSTRLSAIGVAA